MSQVKSKSEEYRDIRIKEIRYLAKELDRIAPDLVGESNTTINFEIHLNFSHDTLPTIKLIREHFSPGSFQMHLNFEEG